MDEMKKCTTCGGRLKKGEASLQVRVGGRTIQGMAEGKKCAMCDETYFSSEAVQLLELRAAALLITRGAVDGESFKFIRKALGLRGADFGAMIGVRQETVSRWETGKSEIDRCAWITLAALVGDALTGQTRTRDWLRAIAEPKPLKRVETVEMAPIEMSR